ncbi:hypothetical protein DPMN_167715 [Dreissena polymorpha]|uniref:Uncharacterized protein n=1 Tax=Dreissena polymorpha TaxID=45954 RepID=A0A9D4EZB7_DREPO|nr:hypothetical protein DPMN_167715 [Dreissena polymorpha]
MDLLASNPRTQYLSNQSIAWSNNLHSCSIQPDHMVSNIKSIHTAPRQHIKSDGLNLTLLCDLYEVFKVPVHYSLVHSEVTAVV